MSDDVRVGVLSLHNSKETKAICNAVAALGHEPLWLRGENLAVATAGGRAQVTPEPDVVVNRLLLPSETEPLTALGLAAAIEATGVPVLNPASSVAVAVHKFAAMARLATAGLPVPASTLGIGPHRMEELGPPAVAAAEPAEAGAWGGVNRPPDPSEASGGSETSGAGGATDDASSTSGAIDDAGSTSGAADDASSASGGIDGTETSGASGTNEADATSDRAAFGPTTAADGSLGRRVFKRPIGTHGDETSMLEPGGYAPQVAGETQGIVQQLIDTPTGDHEDVRIYVVDGEPLGAMRRYAPDDDWRTNVARGGRVRDATDTLPASVMRLASEATELLGLDYAGVDVIEGVDGWYVLEVNTTAGFKGFFEATGLSPAPAIAATAIRRAGGTVDEDRVAELATALDDSVPACKPPLRPSPRPDRSVLGYTTEVRVAGRHGVETVIAKADTGATRTSLDLSLAGEVGAGPILDSATVKGDVGDRPVVPVDVRIGDTTHEVEANVRDRTHLAHDVLLGRDVLEHYSVRVDRRHEEHAAEE